MVKVPLVFTSLIWNVFRGIRLNFSFIDMKVNSLSFKTMYLLKYVYFSICKYSCNHRNSHILWGFTHDWFKGDILLVGGHQSYLNYSGQIDY